MAQKKELVALGSVIVALSAMPAKPAEAATLNMNMAAIILPSPLGMSVTQNLNFGTFTTGGAGGTVQVNTAGAATYLGVNDVAVSAPTEALLRIYGNVGPNITVSVTNTTAVVSNGTDTMVVSQFHLNTIAGGTLETMAMTAATMVVPVGATLNVNASQGAGTYNGTFTVQAVYQ